MSVIDVIVGVLVNLSRRESQWGHFIFLWVQTPQTFIGNLTLTRHLLFTFFFLAAAEENKECPWFGDRPGQGRVRDQYRYKEILCVLEWGGQGEQ